LSTWPSFGRFSDLSTEIERLFESPFAGLAYPTRLLSGWTPVLDVHEDKDSFIVKAELPGMKKEDIEVSLNDGMLSISGERKGETKSEGAEVYRSERFFGRFQRNVAFPAAVAADKIQAAYKDGVLTVTLPKAEETKARKIDVSFN
jgi:HSP20 family protein